MVGGRIINVVQLPQCTWIQCEETHPPYSDVCAIRVERTQGIERGDQIWWQNGLAFWTPVPVRGRVNIELKRIGASHTCVPLDVLEQAYGRELQSAYKSSL